MSAQGQGNDRGGLREAQKRPIGASSGGSAPGRCKHAQCHAQDSREAVMEQMALPGRDEATRVVPGSSLCVDHDPPSTTMLPANRVPDGSSGLRNAVWPSVLPAKPGEELEAQLVGQKPKLLHQGDLPSDPEWPHSCIMLSCHLTSPLTAHDFCAGTLSYLRPADK